MVNELRKIFKAWAFIGLVPCNRRRLTQRWQKVFTIFLVVSNLALTIYGIKYMQYHDNVFISVLVSRLLFVNQTIAFTTNMFEIILNYKQHFRFLERSYRIKVLLRRELSAPIHWRQIYRKLFWKSLFYISIVYGGIVSGTYVISTEYYAGYYGYALLLVLILRMRCLQLIIYVNYIVIYQQTLNRRLNSLVNSKIRRQRAFLDISYKKLESLENLMAAKNCYKEIYEFANIFSDKCGWSLLTLCIGIFLDMMANTYWTILIWEGYYTFSYIYITLSTVLALLVIIFMFCYECELCKRESLVTGRHMKCLLSAPSSKDFNARIYNDLIKEFIIQIMQHPIQIEIKGFFNIDMELLMGTSAAMLTYLVILMQFRSTSPKVVYQ